MSPTFRVGRIAGVEISVNWSWAIVFGLIVWSLGAEVFPEEQPGLAWPAYAAMAVAGALLFFGSLLLHELGHALRARREGMPIEGITLWLFGGVAQLGGEFASAASELRIALAGPAVTAVLGGLFLAVALPGELPGTVETVAAWLGLINLFLLVFNLLPALPLDGGRVLRAALWARRRDYAGATLTAVRVSHGIAYTLVAGGLVLFAVTGTFGGLWLAFLGWFLAGAATAERRLLARRQALERELARERAMRELDEWLERAARTRELTRSR